MFGVVTGAMWLFFLAFALTRALMKKAGSRVRCAARLPTATMTPASELHLCTRCSAVSRMVSRILP